MKEKSLVILAAGMGSRFGGMKQVEPVGPNGEFIVDYSIYSAIKYGINKIIFVIKKENLDLFRETIGKRIEDKVKVEYAFQNLEDIPAGFSVPEGRVKPWGTAHAIYAARDFINGNFGVITADDYYGDIAFKDLSEALDRDDCYSIIGYKISSVCSTNGSVKRGIIMEKNGLVEDIIESSCVIDGDHVVCTPLDSTKQPFNVGLDHSVSMLMTGFTKDILDTVGSKMEDAFKNNQDNLLDFEMLLPDVMADEIKSGRKIINKPTTSKWIGMTYKEDKEELQKFINEEIEKGVYPNNLWN